MNRKDLGKFVSKLFTFKRKTEHPRFTKEETAKLKSQGQPSYKFNRIMPTIQKIRMAQNRKNGIMLKKRKTAKRLLLEERKRKLDITILAEPDYKGE